MRVGYRRVHRFVHATGLVFLCCVCVDWAHAQTRGIRFGDVEVQLLESDPGGSGCGIVGTKLACYTKKVNVSLTTQPTDDVTLTIGNHGPDPEAVTVSPGSLTFTPSDWDQLKPLTLTGVDNDVDDSGDLRSAHIRLFADGGDYGGTNPVVGTLAVGVYDDDEAGIEISRTRMEFSENRGSDTYRIRLTSMPLGALEVHPNIPAGRDSGTVTFQPDKLEFDGENWSEWQTVTVTGVDDDVDNPGTRRIVNVRHKIPKDSVEGKKDGYAENVQARNPELRIALIDDDELPVASIAADRNFVGEDAGSATFTISLSAEPGVAATVHYRTRDGTATSAGGDYTAAARTAVDFAVGETSRKISVAINDDKLDEGVENFTVELLDPSNALLSDVAATARAGILDNDGASVNLSESSLRVAENGGIATYEISLGSEPSGEVTVRLASQDIGMATVKPDSMTFDASDFDEPQSVTVTGVDDSLLEARSTRIVHTITGGGYNDVDVADVDVTVLDDEANLVELDIDPTTITVAEAGGTETYTVVLDRRPLVSVTVALDLDDTGAASVFPTRLLFPPAKWNEAQTIRVTGLDDDVDQERAAVVSHRIRVPGLADTAGGDVTVTVTDDDTAAVTLSDKALTVMEKGNAIRGTGDDAVFLRNSASYGVVLGSEPTGTVTITPQATGPITVTPPTLTFDPDEWDTVKLLTVWGVDDAVDNVGDQHAASVGHTVSGGDYGAIDTTKLNVDVTVLDDDPPPLLSVGDATGSEAAGKVVFEVRLSAVSDKAVQVDYDTGARGDTATAPADYAAVAGGSLRFSPGERTKEIEIAVVDDSVNDPGETFTLTLSNPAGADLGDTEATGTIGDNDSKGISVHPTRLTVAEADDGGTPAVEEHKDTYTVVLDTEPTGAVTIDVRSSDESIATTGRKKLEFNTGNWHVAQTVTVTGRPDALSGDRNVVITHTPKKGGYGGVEAAAVRVTVTDDEAALEVSISDVTIAENVSGGKGELALAMSIASVEEVTVDYTVTDGTAAEGSDYEVTGTGRVVFAPGATTAKIPFTVTDDEIDEGASEHFAVTLSLPRGSPAAIAAGKGTATATITDDDHAGVRVQPTSLVLDETGAGAGGRYTVRLNSRPTREVTVTLSGADPGILTLPQSRSLTFGPGSWKTEQTVSVTAVPDALAGDRATSIAHGVSGYGAVTSAAPVDVTVTDDDGPARLSIADATIAEGVSGGRSAIVLGLSPALVTDLDVIYTVADGTARAGSDYSLASGTLTIPAGATAARLRFGVIDDRVDEGVSEDFTVGVNAGNVVLSRAAATITITDDDRAGARVEPLKLTVSEDGSTTGTYRVKLRSDPEGTADIAFGYDSGVVTLSPASLSVTSATWRRWRKVTVTGVQDNRAADRTATILHTPSGTGGYGGLTANDIDSVEVTVTDDDHYAVTVSPPSLTLDETDDPDTEPREHTGSYQVVLDVVPTGTVTVAVGNGLDASVAGVSTTSLTFTTSDWDEPQEVTVTAVDDRLSNPRGRTGIIDHAARGGGYDNVDVDSVRVRVRDDEDDASIKVVAHPKSLVVDEDGGVATYDLSLSHQPTDTFDVYPNHSDVDTGIATFSATDTTPVRIRPADWNKPHPVTVTGVPDDRYGDRTLTVRHVVHRGAVNGIVEDDTAVMVTVRDDEPRTEVSIDDVQVAENVPGGAGTFTVRAAPPPASDFEVSYTVTAGTAKPAEDYVLADGSVSFKAGVASRGLSFRVVDDALPEETETFTVTLSLPDGSPFRIRPGAGTGTATIRDDDAPGVEIEPLMLTLDETGAGAAGNYRVRLLTDPGGGASVTVTPATADTAVLSLPASPALTFDAATWQSWQTVRVTAVPDRTSGDREATIAHTVSGYGDVTEAEDVKVTVTDDDAGGTLAPGDGVVVREDGSDTDTYTVVLAARPTGPVTVTLDYDKTAVSPDRKRLTFDTTTWNRPQTVVVAGVDDDIDNPGDERRVEIGHTAAGGGYEAVDLGKVPVRVLDDDEAGVEAKPVALTVPEAEAEDGKRFKRYRVRLASKPPGDVVVTVESADKTVATANKESLTFVPSRWNDWQTVRVRGVPDDTAGNRTTTIDHTVSGYGNVVTADSVTVTVEDDGDKSVTVSLPDDLDALSVPEDGSATASYTVVLDAPPTAPVTITVTADPTDATADRTSLTFDTTTWNRAQTVTVTGVDDDIDNPGNKRVTSITHSAAGGGYDGVTVDDVPVDVIDDDTRGITVKPDKVSVPEDGSRKASWTVELDTQPTAAVTVVLAPPDAKTATLDRTSLSFAPGTWNRPQTVVVTGVDDDIDNPGDKRTVPVPHTGRGGDYQKLSGPSVTVDVIDDDDEAVVVIDPTSLSLREGESKTYTVRMTSEPTTRLTVHAHPVDIDTDIATFSHTGGAGVVRLDATNWKEGKTITVTGVQDDKAGDRVLPAVRHRVSEGGKPGKLVESLALAVTVVDDDAGVTVEPAVVTVFEDGSVTADYTVTLDAEPTGPVTIDVTSGDTDIATAGTSRLDFPVATWARARTVTVTGVDDAVDNPGNIRETDITHAAKGGGYQGVAVAGVRAKVVDDDGPGLLVTPLRVTVSEDGSTTGTYTVKLTREPSGPVRVDATVEHKNAASVDLPVLRFGPLTWNAEQTVTVTGKRDGAVNVGGKRDTSIAHSARGGGYDGIEGAAVEVVVTDDDALELRVEPTALTLAESGDGTSKTYTVRLGSKPSRAVKVAVASGDTTIATVDKMRLDFGQQTWNAAQTVTVTSVDDDIDNPGDKRTVAITNTPSGGGYKDVAAVDVGVTVTDDEVPSRVEVPARIEVPEGETRRYDITMTSRPPDGSVTVWPPREDNDSGVFVLEHSDNTDHEFNSITPVRIKAHAWRTAVGINVTARDNNVPNADRTFTVRHIVDFANDGRQEPWPAIEIVILDDDRGITAGKKRVKVTDNGTSTAEYTVVLDAAPANGATTTVAVESTLPEGASVSPATLDFTSENWQVARTVTVTGVFDEVDNPGEERSASITHTARGGGYDDFEGPEVAVKIRDDDSAGVKIEPLALTLDETGAGAAGSYTVRLASEPTAEVTVSISSADATVAATTQKSLTFDADDWKTKQTVDVTAVAAGGAADRMTSISHPVTGYGEITSGPAVDVTVLDGARGVTVDPTAVTVSEDGSVTGEYSVVLTAEPLAGVTVEATVDSGKPWATLDKGSLTFTPKDWSRAQTITVTGVDEADATRTVGNRKTTVAHSVKNYGGATAATVDVTVTDDDAGLVRAPPSLTVNEGAGTSLTPNERPYGLQLRTRPKGKVTVKIRSGDTGIATVSPKKLTFDQTDWDEPKEVTVTGVDDDFDNTGDSRTVEIGHESSGGGYGNVAERPMTITVEDDDTAGIAVDPQLLSIEEMDARDGTYELRLTSEPSGPVTVAIASGDTNIATVEPEQLVFGPKNWSKGKEVTVTAVGDTASGNRTTVVSHSIVKTCSDYCDVDVKGVTVGVSILDDETLPELSVAAASTAEDVEGGKLAFTVKLSNESVHDVTVAYATSDAGATAPDDYTATSGTLTLPAGTTSAQVEVPIVDDDFDEGVSETFRLTLGPEVTHATVSSTGGNTLGTITDDDEAGLEVSPDSLSITEGESATYKVRLTSEPTGDVTVTESPTPAGAVTLDLAKLTFAPSDWDDFQTVTVTATDDSTPGDKSAQIAHDLSGGGYGSVATTPLPVTVTDDEPATITVPDTLTVDEAKGAGHSKRYSVSLSRRPSSPVTIAVSSKDTGVATVLPATLTFSPGTWNAPLEVTVTAEDDDIDNPDPGRRVDIEHAATSEDGAFNDLVETLQVTLRDDDHAGTKVSPGRLNMIDEAPSSTQDCVFFSGENLVSDVCHTRRYGIVLSSQPLGPVTVTVALTPLDAGFVSVTPSRLTFEPDDWNRTQLVTVKGKLLPSEQSFAVANIRHTLGGGVAADGYDKAGVSPVIAYLFDLDLLRTIPVFSVSDESVIEGETATFTLSFSRKAVEGGVGLPAGSYVEWSTGADGRAGATQATSGSDYTAVNTTRIALPRDDLKWSTQVTVSTLEDTSIEEDETFSVDLVGSSFGILLGDTTGHGTIVDDDLPALSIDSVTVAEGETAGFKVTLSHAPAADVTVTATTADGTAVAPGDYTSNSATVTIKAGTTSAGFDVVTIDDAVDEPDETFTVTLSAPSGAAIKPGAGTGTGTIGDNDPPTLEIHDDVVEEGTALSFGISLSSAHDRDVTFTATTSDGTAMAPGDYTHKSQTLTITAGGLVASFVVDTIDDSTLEITEIVRATLSNASVDYSDALALGGILDNDNARRSDASPAEISDAVIIEGGTMRFQVSRSSANRDEAFSVKWITTDDDSEGASQADASSDYTAYTTKQTLNFEANDLIQFIDVQTTEDADIEDDETFKVVLSDPSIGEFDAQSIDRAIGTIRDDDGAEIRITGQRVAEGEKVTLAVWRTGSTAGEQSVDWVTADAGGANQATADTDYTAVTTARTLTFPAGENVASIEVQTTEDSEIEADETFKVRLSNPDPSTKVTIPGAMATVTIEDDDESYSVGDASAAEGGTLTFTLTRTGDTSAASTVQWITGDDTRDDADPATADSDYTAVTTAQTVSFAAGDTSKTVTVASLDDNLVENDETFEVRLSAPSRGILADGTGIGTITDATTLVEIDDASAAEGGTLTFTLTRTGDTSGASTVRWITGDDTRDGANLATAGSDYTAVTTAQTVSFAAGDASKTVTVDSLADNLVENDETFEVRLSNPTGATIADATGIGTITDTTILVEIGDAEAAEGEDLTFTLTRSGDTSGISTVQWTTGADNRDGANRASADSDYTAVTTAQTVSFAVGEASKTVTVTSLDDNLVESDETFEVRLSSPTGGATLADATGIGTITDATTLVEIGDAEAAEGGTLTFTLTRTGDTSGASTVQWITGDDTRDGANLATADSDYTAVTTAQTVSFAAGDASKTVTVASLADDRIESDETFEVRLSNPIGATLAGDTGIGTITDTTRAFVVSDASTNEGEKAAFTITRSGSTAAAATVHWATAEHTGATHPASTTDYTAVNATTVSFAAGERTKTIEVQTTEDTLDEPDETFQVVLTQPSTGTTIADATGTGTIVDDDTPSLALNDVTVAEGASAAFTITLSQVQATDVTVTATTSDGTAVAGADYTHITQTVTIAAGATTASFNVATLEDTLDEPNETFTVGLAQPSTGIRIARSGTGTITDATTLVEIGDAEAAEGGTLTFTLTRTGDTSGASTVQWITGDDTRDGANLATADSDYTAVTTAQTVSFAAGDASKTVTVASLADDRIESDETFEVRLSNPIGATLAGDTGIGTITDTTRAFVVSDASTNEGEKAAFTITRSGSTAAAATVHWATAEHTGATHPASTTDYTAVNATTVSFAAGERTKTIEVQTTEDTLDEPDETFQVVLTQPSTGTTIADATGTGTIVDDDTPSLALNDVTVAEGASAAFTITLSQVQATDVTVTATTSDGTAVAGADYTHTTQTVTIAAGATTASFNVATLEDTLDEPNETFTVGLAQPSTGIRIARSGTGTITDATTLVEIDDAEAAEGGTLTFTLTRKGDTSGASTVQWITGDDTRDGANLATAGSDYTAVTTAQTVSFAAGDASKTVTVASLADNLVESDETFEVRLSSPTGATLAGDTGIGTITDTTRAFVVSDASTNEGEKAAFTITRSGSTAAAATVHWATAEHTGATHPASTTDYTAVNATTVSFAAGERTKTIEVQTTEDTLDEPDETFQVVLTQPSTGTTIADATGTGTIVDDDTPSLALNDVTVAEGASAAFTITLSQVQATDVTVTATTSDGTAVAGADYTHTTQTVTIAAGATTASFNVATLEDTLDEPNETFTVGLAQPSTGIRIARSGTGTITDATTLVEIDDAEAAEGGTLTFTLTRTGDTSGASTVQWITGDDTRDGADLATAGSDYTAVTTAQTVSFAAGEASKTVTVTSLADNLVENDETFEVRLSNPTGATLADDTGIGTITDDDGAPTLSINDVTVTEGDIATFTIALSAASGRDVTVTAATADGTATAGSDYTARSAVTVTIAAGDTSASFTVATTEDTLDEPNETFEVRLSSPTGATLAGDTGIGTITDTTTLIEIGDAKAAEGEDLAFTLTRTGDTSGASTVQWITGDDTRDGADLATAGSDYTAVTTAQTVSFAAGDASKTVTVASLDDNLVENDETFEVRLSSPTGATLAGDTGIGTITDDDDVPALSIDDVTVGEGDAATFTVTLSAASGRAVTVTATTADGTATAPDDYANRSAAVTLAAGQTEATFAVATVGDTVDEPDETFTVTLSAASGATIAVATGTVTILDDDLPTLSIDNVEVVEGNPAGFRISLSRAQSADVTVVATTVDGTATAPDDYKGHRSTVVIAAGQTEAPFMVTTLKDEIHDPNEDFKVMLSEPKLAALAVDEGKAMITEQVVEDRITRINEAILPPVASSLMRNWLDRMTSCIDHAVSDAPDTSPAPLLARLASHMEQRDQGGDRSLREALGGAWLATALPADEEQPGRGDLTFCAGGDWRRLSDDGPIEWDGELFSAHAGGNVRLNREFVTGLELWWDEGRFDWTDRTGSTPVEGRWQLRLDGLHPYAMWLSPEGKRLWAMAVFGSGELDVDGRHPLVRSSDGTETGELRYIEQSADVTQTGVALGGELPLATNTETEGVSFALRGDLWLGRFDIEGNGDLLKGLSVDTRGMRGFLERSRQRDLENGASLASLMRIGAQYDDAAGGAGVEVGTDVAWRHPSGNLSASLRARVLTAGNGLTEWGVGGDVRLASANGLGPQFSVSTSRGDTADGTDAMWKGGSEATARGADDARGLSLDTETGWGTRARGGLWKVTPFTGLSLSSEDARTLRTGVRLGFGEALSLGLEGQRHEGAGDVPVDRRLLLRVEIR